MDNNNKQELGVKKYYTEPERIYYHCTSLRRLLKERKDIELLQSLENSLRQQNLFKDKEKKEGCYRCGDKSHWIKDCTQPENYKKKPPYGECYYCHSPSHWVPNCPHIEKALSDENMPSTSSQQEQEETSSSSMTTTKRKRSRSPYVDDDDEEEEEHRQKRRRQTTLHSTPQQKNTRKGLRKKKANKPYCFVCKEDGHSMKDCDQILDNQ